MEGQKSSAVQLGEDMKGLSSVYQGISALITDREKGLRTVSHEDACRKGKKQAAEP